MPDEFDPYHHWLGIAPSEQPPNHYRLLNAALFEHEAEVIENLASQRLAHVRTFQLSRHAAHSHRLLNELAAARICLLDPVKREAYDAQLRAKLAPRAAKVARAATLPPAAIPAAKVPAVPAALEFDTDSAARSRRGGKTATQRKSSGTNPLVMGAVTIGVVIGLGALLLKLNQPSRPTVKQPTVATKNPANKTKPKTKSEPQAKPQASTVADNPPPSVPQPEPESEPEPVIPATVASEPPENPPSFVVRTVPIADEEILANRLVKVLGADFLLGWGNNGSKQLIVNVGNHNHPNGAQTFLVHSVNLHPSPTRATLLVWTSPVDAKVQISGSVDDADPGSGNGVAWHLRLRHKEKPRDLLYGAIANGGHTSFSDDEFATLNLSVEKGDRLELAISANHKNHNYDLTRVELKIAAVDQALAWDASDEFVESGLETHPIADRYRNPNVWHCSTMPSDAALPVSDPIVPTDP